MSWLERVLWFGALGAFYITAVFTYNATVDASVIYYQSESGAEIGACYLDAPNPLIPISTRSYTCISGARFGNEGPGLGLRIGSTRREDKSD